MLILRISSFTRFNCHRYTFVRIVFTNPFPFPFQFIETVWKLLPRTRQNKNWLIHHWMNAKLFWCDCVLRSSYIRCAVRAQSELVCCSPESLSLNTIWIHRVAKSATSIWWNKIDGAVHACVYKWKLNKLNSPHTHTHEHTSTQAHVRLLHAHMLKVYGEMSLSYERWKSTHAVL